MIHIYRGYSLADNVGASMFRDRKQQFVDQLGWTVPVVAGQYEIDRYDGDDAHYLIAADADGGHAGSMRLLPTIRRSEEHTSELQSLMRISYAVFCLKKKNTT